MDQFAFPAGRPPSGSKDRTLVVRRCHNAQSTVLNEGNILGVSTHTENSNVAEGAKSELCLGSVRWRRSDRDNSADWPDARVLGPKEA
jgi:hypothetical protein